MSAINQNRSDIDILLYGSDAATSEQRAIDVGAANVRLSASARNPQYGYVDSSISAHGMASDGGANYRRIRVDKPEQHRLPVPERQIQPTMARSEPDKISTDDLLHASLLNSMLSNRGKKQPVVPPKIEIKNPALPQKKDYTVIVALIGLATVMMGKRK